MLQHRAIPRLQWRGPMPIVDDEYIRPIGGNIVERPNCIRCKVARIAGIVPTRQRRRGQSRQQIEARTGTQYRKLASTALLLLDSFSQASHESRLGGVGPQTGECSM